MELLAVSVLSPTLDSSLGLAPATRLLPSSNSPCRLSSINDMDMFVGTKQVSTKALKRACFLVKFLLADRMDIVRIYYDHFARVVVMDANTSVKDIKPYKKYITYQYDNMKTGLGGILLAPVTTIATKDAECNFDRPGIDHGFRVQCLMYFSVANKIINSIMHMG